MRNKTIDDIGMECKARDIREHLISTGVLTRYSGRYTCSSEVEKYALEKGYHHLIAEEFADFILDDMRDCSA